MILRILKFKFDQKPLTSWLLIILLVFAQCAGTIIVPLSLGASTTTSFYEEFLSGMTSPLNLGFIFGVILIFLTSDVYQNRYAWNRNLLIRTGTRRRWLLAHIFYLVIVVLLLIFAILASYYITSVFLLDPKTVLQNFWTDPEYAKQSLVDNTAWKGSPAGAVCMFSILMFCRFMFISLVILGINLSQKKAQFGFCFPLLLGLLEWKFNDLVPSLSKYPILPYTHTFLVARTQAGLPAQRVPIWISFLYWGILLGITFTWLYVVTMKKDFATLEDNQ